MQAASLLDARALWYLTRGTGLVALVLVTLSVVIGIASSLRAGGARTPRFVVSGLHRNVSLLLVAFIVIHVVTTILDAYAPIRLIDAVIPFVSAYRPIWLGLGALAFDLILALVITSLVRVRIGLKTWRGIHWFAYACFPIVVVHALGTGTDASQHWLLGALALCGTTVALAVLWRLWQVRPEGAATSRADGAGLVVPVGTGYLAGRLLGTAAVIAAPVLAAAWALAGPLAPHWSARGGGASPHAQRSGLAALAATQAGLERERAREIAAAQTRVKRELAAIHAATVAVQAASVQVSTVGSTAVAATGGGSPGVAVGAGAATSVPAAAAPVAAAPVAATGGS